MNQNDLTPEEKHIQYIWLYDSNRRVYTDPETGIKSASPIYKYSWVKCQVIGETRLSWICNFGYSPKKISKKRSALWDLLF